MKIKRITEITAVVLFIVFALLMVFSTRQDLFSTRYIEPYNAGWTYSFGDESGEAVLPAQYHLPKDTQLTLTNTLPEKIREGAAGHSAPGSRMSACTWETGWYISSRSRN